MATFNKYTAAVGPLLEAINAGSDSWKVALAATVNAADTTFVAGTTDLATGGGYTQGGNDATVSTHAVSAGVYKLVLNSPTAWTATGSGFSFRYVILYDATTNTPVGYWDYGSTVTMNGTNGDTFTATLDATSGVFQVS